MLWKQKWAHCIGLYYSICEYIRSRTSIRITYNSTDFVWKSKWARHKLDWMCRLLNSIAFHYYKWALFFAFVWADKCDGSSLSRPLVLSSYDFWVWMPETNWNKIVNRWNLFTFYAISFDIRSDYSKMEGENGNLLWRRCFIISIYQCYCFFVSLDIYSVVANFIPSNIQWSLNVFRILFVVSFQCQ